MDTASYDLEDRPLWPRFQVDSGWFESKQQQLSTHGNFCVLYISIVFNPRLLVLNFSHEQPDLSDLGSPLKAGTLAGKSICRLSINVLRSEGGPKRTGSYVLAFVRFNT